MDNKKHKKTKGSRKIKDLQKAKVYYYKDDDILFEYNGKVVRLKEFHEEGMSITAPFNEDEAKYIAHKRRAFLKVRR